MTVESELTEENQNAGAVTTMEKQVGDEEEGGEGTGKRLICKLSVQSMKIQNHKFKLKLPGHCYVLVFQKYSISISNR